MPKDTSLSPLRDKWCSLLGGLTFEDAAHVIQKTLHEEVEENPDVLKAHLFLAGVIPEQFGHDSTAEKVFAKYGDTVVAMAFSAIGCTTEVITERADRADVDIWFGGTSLVADAKAFRLSRTAKNQKDFKVEALDGWRHGADGAVLVGPLFQYPTRQSQIYEQATRRNVLLLSFTHLRALLDTSEEERLDALRGLLGAPSHRSPEKSAESYWGTLRARMFDSATSSEAAWRNAIAQERKALDEVVQIEKFALENSLGIFAAMERDELIAEVTRAHGIEERLIRVRRAKPTKVFDY